MKLKSLLAEKVSRRNVNKIRKNCKTFLRSNKNKLLNGNFLYRGTSSEYTLDVIEKSFRKRREIKGDPFNTWVYEYFKKENHPSRQDMIPSEYGELRDLWRKNKNVFCVFPIGNSYLLHYTDGVKDFNSNNSYFSPLTSFNSIFYSMKALPDAYNLNDNQREKVKDFLDVLYSIDKTDYQSVKEEMNRHWNYLKNLQEEGIENAGTKVKQIEHAAHEFFQNSSFSLEMPNEVGLEVNIYAPDGFYYVSETTKNENNYVGELIKKVFD